MEENHQMVQVRFHSRPLFRAMYCSMYCYECKEWENFLWPTTTQEPKRFVRNKQKGYHYYCKDCSCAFPWRWVEEPRPETNHHLHPRHPLVEMFPCLLFDPKKNCDLCGEEIYCHFKTFYHCSICDFNLHLECARNSPPPAMEEPKCHDHMLTLLPRRMSFSCNACGLLDDRYPAYVCIPCDFMVHKDCIGLPHVIKITRHSHRLSHTSSLPPGKWVCGVCRKEIDNKYGQYSCIKGCSYAIHSKCATRKDVWDGKELEGVPEEPEEDIEPFKKIDDRTIHHFSHEHYLLRLSEALEECNKLCEACIRPIQSGDIYYGCMLQCDFTLHEKCANLPRKMHHAIHKHPLTLLPTDPQASTYVRVAQVKGSFSCSACSRISCGFKYKCYEKGCGFKVDVLCALIPDPLTHKSHEHPLFLTSQQDNIICNACKGLDCVLNCVECDFTLCFTCASLPESIDYKYDRHALVLSCGEEEGRANGTYWCEGCEKVLDPKTWFYTCDECCVTLHKACALGRYPYMKPGKKIGFDGYEFDIAYNNGSSRPTCVVCRFRCEDTLVFKGLTIHTCSLFCTLYGIPWALEVCR
ncbi:PREDICTED: uncharacterized protein LOC104803981 [Tarenaya hassleriana]|uniref:uncharacterized protein LOC104803981 n=1 Tax=Tarenaya hassleriana TaxID=28532 RepID=UPI00053C3AEB|nr:PREDICTED: uncharacterized protein LOC104803981 [Tarenaya hassleriana]